MKVSIHAPGGGPCRFMRPLLDAAADGRARGLRAWYARAHAARCPGCGRYLESLGQVVRRLKETSSSPADEEALARLVKRLEK